VADAQAGAPGPAAVERPNWKRRAILVAVGLAVVVVAVLVGASALPRWWSHRVGDQVDGDLTTGIFVGFVYGFFATVLPLLVLALVVRFFRRHRLAWAIGLLLALLLAAPNLLTLGIVVGNGNAAHAADRTLDVEAPWFRGGMLIGVVAGLATFAFGLYVLVSRRRARDHGRHLRDELEGARGSGPPPG
jgi:F0F1-type ATP synthase assembly protein I